MLRHMCEKEPAPIKVHEEKNLWVFKCSLCRLERSTQKSIETHIEMFHNGMCKICSAHFPNFEDLAQHVDEKHCNENTSSSQSELRIRMKHS